MQLLRSPGDPSTKKKGQKYAPLITFVMGKESETRRASTVGHDGVIADKMFQDGRKSHAETAERKTPGQSTTSVTS